MTKIFTHPLHLGGLGMMDFNLLGWVLRLWWLRLSRTDDAWPWALHPVSDDTTTESFQASISCVINDGQSTFFWNNPWMDGWCNGVLMLELLDVVQAHAWRWRMVASTLAGHAWIRDISSALTIPVLMQYLHLHQQLDNIALSPGVTDRMI
jgi:hypothetical protein